MKHRSTNGRWIYRTRITTRRGKVIYAAHYGLKAFRLWIKAA